MTDGLQGVLDEMVEGAVNLRDVGGLPADGGMRVRRGLVFRSGMTHTIGAAGLQVLAEQHRVRTVVDLRNGDELETDGVAAFEGVGIRHRHAPVSGINALSPEERVRRMEALMEGSLTWAEAYRQYLDKSRDAFGTLLQVVADADSLSVVFHCSAGRDRTGVSAALLLATLGVEELRIAGDYARTGDLLRPHVQKFADRQPDIPLDERRFAMIVTTPPETITEFFGYVREDYGSTEAYLESCGVDAALVRELRGRLLEPA